MPKQFASGIRKVIFFCSAIPENKSTSVRLFCWSFIKSFTLHLSSTPRISSENDTLNKKPHSHTSESAVTANGKMKNAQTNLGNSANQLFYFFRYWTVASQRVSFKRVLIAFCPSFNKTSEQIKGVFISSVYCNTIYRAFC